MIDPQLLLNFKAIVKYKSINHAAQATFTSSSSLSRSLKKLEDEIGSPVFDRHGTHLVLNECGTILLHYSDLVDEELSRASITIARMRIERDTSLNVFFKQPLGNPARVVAPFMRDNPSLRLKIVSTISESRESGTNLELISSVDSPNPENSCLVANDFDCLVVPRESPWSSFKSMSLADARHEPFVEYEPADQRIESETSQLCRTVGFIPKRIISCPQFWACIEYVKLGAGVMLAQALSATAGLDDDVSIVPLTDIDQKRNLYLVWQEGSELNENELLFGTYLKDYFTKLSQKFQTR